MSSIRADGGGNTVARPGRHAGLATFRDLGEAGELSGEPGAIPESFLEPLTVLPPGPTQSESSSRKQPTEEPQGGFMQIEEEEEPEYLAETEERKPPPSQTSHHPSAIFFHRAPPHYQAPSSQPPPPTPTPTRPRVPRTAKPMIVGQEGFHN
eukprot:1392267-Amorphochlora_amoeboformis.AAC.4